MQWKKNKTHRVDIKVRAKLVKANREQRGKAKDSHSHGSQILSRQLNAQNSMR